MELVTLWDARAEGGNDSEFRQTTSGAHGSASRADCLPRGKPHACDGIRQLCRMRTPAGGMTRRLRRGSGTYCPMGRSHFSFGGERKVCKRKPAARRLQRRPAPLRVAGFGLREPFGLSSTSVRFAHPPGKRLLLPILTAGLAMSRAAWLVRLRMQSCALGARLFPPSKWAGLFPSAAYRRSAPPQLAWGILTSCGLKGFLRLGCFATQKREACASPQWTAGRLTHCGAEYYRGNKGQRVFFCTLAFSASHEACRRMAV